MHSLQVENGLSVGHNEEKVERAQRKISGDKLFLLLLHHGTV